MVAESMYWKGKSFLGAAILLRKSGGYEYVVLHLLCQGIEIVLKALLLLREYDTYKPMLKKEFGHNLVKLANAVVAEFKSEPIPSEVESELRNLNDLYSRHLLRYGSLYDRLVNPSTISSELVMRKMAAIIHLTDRHLT